MSLGNEEKEERTKRTSEPDQVVIMTDILAMLENIAVSRGGSVSLDDREK